MMAHARHAASSDVQDRGRLALPSVGGLLRRLKSIAAQYGDQEEVVAVCEKWVHRLLALERQAIDAGIPA